MSACYFSIPKHRLTIAGPVQLVRCVLAEVQHCAVRTRPGTLSIGDEVTAKCCTCTEYYLPLRWICLLSSIRANTTARSAQYGGRHCPFVEIFATAVETGRFSPRSLPICALSIPRRVCLAIMSSPCIPSLRFKSLPWILLAVRRSDALPQAPYPRVP